jgi:hypothetical protein
MNIRSHYNFKELAVDSIDRFNKRLRELDADYKLNDDPDAVEQSYNICIASKKNGQPKDDYPGKFLFEIFYHFFIALSFNSSVKQMMYVHFALCVFSKAFLKTAAPAAQLQPVAKQSHAQASENQGINQSSNVSMAKDRDSGDGIFTHPKAMENKAGAIDSQFKMP